MKTLFIALIISGIAVAAPEAPKQSRWNKLMVLVGQEMKILESA